MRFRSILCLLLAGGTLRAGPLIDGTTPEARSAAFLRYEATTLPQDPDYPKTAISKYVARLLTGTAAAYAAGAFEHAATATLARSAAGPRQVRAHALDPFDKHALLHGWLLCRSRLTPATAAAIRDYMRLWHHRAWTGYGAMNYRLMMDGCGLVAAEQWPDLVDADGLDAAAIKRATRERLLGYFTAITHHNFHEYEAPTYLGIDLSALEMLADFAQDPDVRARAGMTLDWLFANLAVSWNQGYNVSPAGRAKYWGSTDTSPDAPDAAAGVGWLVFGGSRAVNPAGMNDALSIWFAAPGGHRPPAILTDIARDRARPFAHRGSVILGGQDNVRITIYQTPSYGLASQAEFLAATTHGLYKETRRQMLKWLSDFPSSTFCPLQENPRRPYAMGEHVANAWGYGENPFGQTMQCEGTLLGVCNAPPDYPYYKLYVPFSLSGSIVRRVEREGWVCCHAGSMLFAFRSVQPWTWGKPEHGYDVLWSDNRRAGWILETSPLAPYAGGGPDAELGRFAAAILKKTHVDATGIDLPRPVLKFRSLSGYDLELTYRPHAESYSGQHSIDGNPIDYRSFPLIGNPWMNQSVNGDILTIRHGTASVVYDFRNWEVR